MNWISGLVELFKSGGYGAITVGIMFILLIISYFLYQAFRLLKANWVVIDRIKKDIQEQKDKTLIQDTQIECIKPLKDEVQCHDGLLQVFEEKFRNMENNLSELGSDIKILLRK